MPQEATDWTKSRSKITPHFTVGEACWLPSWNCMHRPTLVQQMNILDLAQRLEELRKLLGGHPFNIHCWMRPNPTITEGPRNGQDYNSFVGSTAPNSGHLTGKAVDFHVRGFHGQGGCAEMRQRILPHLDALGLRMEDINGAWIHLDTKPVGSRGRFFKP